MSHFGECSKCGRPHDRLVVVEDDPQLANALYVARVLPPEGGAHFVSVDELWDHLRSLARGLTAREITDEEREQLATPTDHEKVARTSLSTRDELRSELRQLEAAVRVLLDTNARHCGREGVRAATLVLRQMVSGKKPKDSHEALATQQAIDKLFTASGETIAV